MGILGFHIMPCMPTLSARLKELACAASAECAVWVPLARIVVVTDTPIALPTLRMRLIIALPSVRKTADRVANATRFMGTKTSPMPRPCTKVTSTSDHAETDGVHLDISHMDHRIRHAPKAMM